MVNDSKEQITLRMNQVLAEFEGVFNQTCNQYLARRLINRLNSADLSEYKWVRRDLEETLRENSVQVEIRYDQKGHIANEEDVVNAFPSGDELENQLYKRLSDMYVQFPGTGQFIERLVLRLGDPVLGAGSVRLRILKQFLLYIKKSVYSVKKLRSLIEESFSVEERAEFSRLKKENDKRLFYAVHAREELFNVMENPEAFGLKKDDTRLLVMSDNFSRGRILNQGGTRKAIYEFAIVFGMNAYPRSDPRYDPERDVEKNLFFDFQINGYIGSLRERNKNAGADTANEELTTEGINYKNYAEIIYLFVLNHPEIPREEKIYRALELIKKCSASSPEEADRITDGTTLFRSHAILELMSDKGYQLDEENLIRYIKQNYPAEENRSISPLLHSAEQNTARSEYLRLCEQIEDELRLYDRSLDDLDYSLGIFLGKGSEPEENEFPFPQDLRIILVDLNEELCRHVERRKDIVRGYKETKSRKGEIRKEAIVLRRLDFLVLYYEFFIAVHEDDGEEEIMTLEDIYRSFADHLNPVFNKSRYAEISSKSMPDMILILFAYNMVSLLS